MRGMQYRSTAQPGWRQSLNAELTWSLKHPCSGACLSAIFRNLGDPAREIGLLGDKIASRGVISRPGDGLGLARLLPHFSCGSPIALHRLEFLCP